MANAPQQIESKSYAIGFLILILFSAWWYLPGLQGLFILDDEANLDGLAQISSTNFWADLQNFIFSGNAGTVGRSISLLSFALQAPYWPNPVAFKSINLAIHLLNGCLIAWLLISWGRLQQIPLNKIQAPILLICAIWLLSPIQISTVLYVVQRMAQLSVFFILLGLLLYSQGRYHCMQNRLKLGYSIATIGIAIMGILAIFSKENGALLIVYASVLELTLWQNLKTPRYWRVWRAIFLYTPVIILFGYLGLIYDSNPSYQILPFNQQERLYTESRILWDYLSNTLLPLNQNFSLFHDDYNISHSLFASWQTTLALSAWLLTIGFAIKWRRQYPLFSFAVLWYIAGHSLESTFLPLRLYFEHRNYLALLAPIAALIYFLNLQWQQHPDKRRLIGLISLLWFSLMLFVSHQEIKLWRNPVLQAIYWAENHPQSRYAQSNAAALMVKINQTARAAAYYQTMQQNFPQDSSPKLFQLSLHCYDPSIATPTQLLQHLSQSQNDGGAHSALDKLYQQLKNADCPERLNAKQYKQILQTLSNNPNWPKHTKSSLYYFLAQTYALEQNYAAAIKAIDQAFQHNLVNAKDSKLIRIFWLIQLKHYDQAHASIQEFRQQLRSVDYSNYAPELDKLQSLIQFLQKS